jgi:DNA primase
VLVLITLPAEQVTVGVPQASVAEGAVWFAQVGTVGLHPRSVPGAQLSNAGAVVSSVHVHVLEQVEEFEQASVAV